MVLDESKLITNDRFESVPIALLHGFPSSMNKQKKALYETTSFKVRAFAYGGVIQKHFKFEKVLGKKAPIHTCMRYEKTKNNNKPISPKGISGGGLWILPLVNGVLNDFYLDSILIEYHKNHGVTFSTRIDCIIFFIKNNT